MLAALVNVPAGIGYPLAWAATIGALAYVLGRSGGGALGAIGFVDLGLAGLVYVVTHVRRLTAHRKPPSEVSRGRATS